VTQRQRQELFEIYNRRFFEGRLPAYRIVVGNRYGTGNGLHGFCRKKEREIHLDPRLRGVELKKVLLHEMAHAATRGTHGKQWLAEMFRLAEMGAPTREDWKAYQDQAQTLGPKNIAAECYDAGVETDLSWSSVRSRCGRENGLIDDRGRSVSTGASNTLLLCGKEFSKGRRWRRSCPRASSAET
jgi:hypothetical protein